MNGLPNLLSTESAETRAEASLLSSFRKPVEQNGALRGAGRTCRLRPHYALLFS